MSIANLGNYETSGTDTRVRHFFSTHEGAGANVAPSSAFEAADLRIYRAAAGAAFSATQRSSASGITMTSPFDSLVGFHALDIDLTDNTDAGFYAEGYLYAIVLSPDETIDSQAITGLTLAYFTIGLPKVDVRQVNGDDATESTMSEATIAAAVEATFPTNFSTLLITSDGYISRVVLCDTITTYTGNTPQTADSNVILAHGTYGNAAIKTQTAAIEVDTADIQSRLPAALVSGRMDSYTGAMGNNVLTAAVIAANAIDADSINQDALDAIAGEMATTDDFYAALLADMDVSGSIGKAFQDMFAGTTPVYANMTQIDSNATAAARLGQMFTATRLIIVDDASFSPTTTAFDTDQTTDAQARYTEQVLFALDGNNTGYTVRVTGYSYAAGKVRLTVDTLPAAPADGHRFLLMGRIEQ